jgi:tetratricopeptide (TPR) repeat protein
MSNNNSLLTFKNLLLFLIVLFLPMFFFPFVRDFLVISKLYFLFYTVLVMAVVAFIYLITTKRIVIHKNPFSAALVLILIAIMLSTLLVAPNKVQALLSPRFGFFLIASMSLFFLFLTELLETRKQVVTLLLITAGTIVSFFSIIAIIRPFRSLELGWLSFIDNASFNFVGSSIEMGIFLGFVLVLIIMKMMHADGAHKHEGHNHQQDHGHSVKRGYQYRKYDLNPLYFVSLVIITIALCLQVYFIVKSTFFDNQTLLISPWNISWYAAIETLKNPFTALFGVGIHNFVSIFTQAKDVSYNLSELWQVTSFTVSRSTILHILTEGGIIAFVGFMLIFLKVYETFKHASITSRVVIVYAGLSLLLWPPSIINFFVFFVGLAYYAYDVNQHNVADTYIFDFKKVMPLYITAIVLSVVTLGFASFFITNALISEILYGRSIQAVQQNNLQELYQNQRAAIQFNPYNEEFRRDFSQTNLLIANNFSARNPEEITDQDRQAITQAIQAAIAESKAAVSLNSQNAVNWQHLANTYKNILNVAEGAAEWTVAAYQRSIVLDPQNPSHRLELGGIFYLAENYAQAERLFEQAVNLKPDWSNAHYNLAWSKYQQGKYQEALFSMQQVLSLIDAEANEEDMQKVQEEIAMIQEKVSEQTADQEQATEEDTPTEEPSDESELSLPEQEEGEPIIDLPEEAAPPAEGEEETIDLDASRVDLEAEEGSEDGDQNVGEDELILEEPNAGTTETDEEGTPVQQ